MPAANVIVNPNQPGCEFPSKNLAGVGVIFYIMLALRAELRAASLLISAEAEGMTEPLDLLAAARAEYSRLPGDVRALVDAGMDTVYVNNYSPQLRDYSTAYKYKDDIYQRLEPIDSDPT